MRCHTQVGLRDQSISGLLRAADDASRGRTPGDPAFSFTCRLLARYLSSTEVRHELSSDLANARRYARLLPAAAIEATERAVQADEAVNPAAIGRWQEVCANYPSSHAADDVRERLVLIHVTALLGRYHVEIGDAEIAGRLFDTLTASHGHRDSIFLFVREDHAERLLARGLFRKALELCQPVLEHTDVSFPHAHERFAFRQLAARAHLGLGATREAYRYALLALSD